MEERDVDVHLNQHLSGQQPRETFRQEALRDSMASFVRIHRRRSARRRAECAAAAVLIAGIAFFSGRLSAPPPLPGNVDIASQAAAEPEGVAVSSDLVAWLDAARLFGRLGMQDRMARAVERAGRLLPADIGTMDDRTDQVFVGGFVEDQEERIEPMVSQGSQPSSESINQILAQFGRLKNEK
jgi:hypothetical protein